MTTRLVTQEVTKSPTRLAAGLPIPLLLMPLQTDLRLLRGVGSVTFTRSTIKRYLRKDTGLITVAAIDEPAFEQNGILIEGDNTNLAPRSEEFENSAWSKRAGMTVTANQVISPDGTLTGDKLESDGTQPATFGIQQNAGTVNGEYTNSVFVRSGNITECQIIVKDRLSDTIRATTTVTDLTSEWLRIDATGTTAGASTGVRVEITVNGQTGFIHIWGGQAEILPFASSYIKTVASTVTRTDEDTDIETANNPAPTADYTVSMEVDAIGFDSSLSQVLFNVEGETSRRIAWNTTTGAIEATHGAVTSVSTSTFVAGDRVKISFAVGAINQTLYINGVQEDQDAKGTVTGTATALNIGHQAGVNQAFSHIKPLRIDDTELTAAQAGAL